MVMSWIFTVIVAASTMAAVYFGKGSAISSAVVQGAQSGVTLAVSLAGSICLWTGVGHLMTKIGLMRKLSSFLMPLLQRLFPTAKKDAALSESLSANICANFLGLGNAATPMGIQAARRLAGHGQPGIASDQLCRLIVLNTASIQLIPTNVAAVRSSLGCSSPFDILPAVWITSLCSASLGLCAAWLFGKLWRHA